MAKKKTVTQAAIAKEAGLTTAVVSVALSGRNSGTINISEAARARVIEIATRLGYVAPSSTKLRSDSGRRSVVLIERAPVVESNQPWGAAGYDALMSRIYSEVAQCVSSCGMDFSVHPLQGDGSSLIQYLGDSDACGVIWHASEENKVLLRRIASRYPLVALNRSWGSEDAFDEVGVNQEMNIGLAAAYLWSLGHRKIATFGHLPGSTLYQRRIAAYRRFVNERGVRDYVEFQQISDAMDRSPQDKINEILETWTSLGAEAPTAIITADIFALRLLTVAKDRGMSIPDDLSIIGIDDSEPCDLVRPCLTSIRQPYQDISQVAVELLMRRIEDRKAPARSVQVAPQLIRRESVKSFFDIADDSKTNPENDFSHQEISTSITPQLSV